MQDQRGADGGLSELPDGLLDVVPVAVLDAEEPQPRFLEVDDAIAPLHQRARHGPQDVAGQVHHEGVAVEVGLGGPGEQIGRGKGGHLRVQKVRGLFELTGDRPGELEIAGDLRRPEERVVVEPPDQGPGVQATRQLDQWPEDVLPPEQAVRDVVQAGLALGGHEVLLVGPVRLGHLLGRVPAPLEAPGGRDHAFGPRIDAVLICGDRNAHAGC